MCNFFTVLGINELHLKSTLREGAASFQEGSSNLSGIYFFSRTTLYPSLFNLLLLFGLQLVPESLPRWLDGFFLLKIAYSLRKV